MTRAYPESHQKAAESSIGGASWSLQLVSSKLNVARQVPRPLLRHLNAVTTEELYRPDCPISHRYGAVRVGEHDTLNDWINLSEETLFI